MTLHVSLSSESTVTVSEYASSWQTGQMLDQMWDKDATLWADARVPEISDRLGWLDAPELSRSLVHTIETLFEQAKEEGITDIVLCGMGGSSLAPEVLAATLPTDPTSPRLTVIDSTHPDAVESVASATEPSNTWYIVASKSGGTIETMSLFKLFWQRTIDSVIDPGSHFIAITDPGTSLETLAEQRGFRATVTADPNVGGRYSALTAFGLVPTGLIGGDVGRLLESAQHAASMCQSSTPIDENPGFGIGVVLAQRALRGSDKAQFICSEPVATLGIWIEQLIAESTGKEGLGIVPIDGGPLLDHCSDTTIVAIGAQSAHGSDIELTLTDPYDVAGAMFILEFATAVAGKILGINPFDQPDVQLAKKLATSAMEDELELGGVLPTPFTEPRWATRLQEALETGPPSYVSIQAYIPQTRDNALRLHELRELLTRASSAHVTVGFGPRFLHSTGQLHKGGPPGGVYLQIIDATTRELSVPETSFTFDELITAQAAGDRAALADRNRTVIAVDLGIDATAGLTSMVSRLSSGA